MSAKDRRTRYCRSQARSDTERSDNSTRRSQSSADTADGVGTLTSAKSTAEHDNLLSPPSPERGPGRRTVAGQRGPSQRDLTIQRAMEGTGTSSCEVPEQVLDVIGSGGMPLDPGIQRSLEERIDADFSDVTIHTGSKAAEAADAIDARAFTCGNAIVFNSGEFDPYSPEGQHLLAHELAHVKQQNGGAPLSMMPQEGADLEIDPDPHLEREADRAAEEALSGEEPLTVSRMGTDVHIQRSTDEDMSRRAFLTLGNEELGKPADDQQGLIEGFLQEFTDLEFRIPVEELEELATSVDSVEEMYSFLAERDIEPTSDLEEWADSPLLRAYNTGSMTSSVLGLLALGFTPQAVAALAAGLGAAAVLKRYGDDIGEEASKWLRKRLSDDGDAVIKDELVEGDSQADELGK